MRCHSISPIAQIFFLLTLLLVLGILSYVSIGEATSRPEASTSLYMADMTRGDSDAGWRVPSCGSFETAPYHTVPGLSLSFSVDRDSVLDLNFAGLGRNSTNYGAVYSSFFVDGQKLVNAFGHEQLGGRRQGTANGMWIWHSLANVAAVDVGPGSHTVEVKVKCDPSGSEARVWNGWLNVGVYGK